MAGHWLNTRSEEKQQLRNEVTCRIPEEFGAVEWTFYSPSIATMKTGRGKGGKALKQIGHENNADFRTD